MIKDSFEGIKQHHRTGFPRELDRAYDRYVLSEGTTHDFAKLIERLMGYAELYENFELKDVAIWINTLFAYILCPLECNESNWKLFTGELLKLLSIQNRILSAIEDEYIFIHKEGRNDGVQLGKTAVFKQNLDFYYAVAYWFLGDKLNFRRHSEIVLHHTKHNIATLLHTDDAEELYSQESRKDDFYIHGMRYWQEPLAWQAYEAIDGGYERELIPIYVSYVNFLKDISECNHRSVLAGLISNAEKQLIRLCDCGRERDEMELIDKIEEIAALQSEIEKYNRMLEEIESENENEASRR